METADRVFRGYAAPIPCRFLLDALDAAQRKASSVEVFEREPRLAEALGWRVMADPLLDEAMGPVADRAFRYAEGGLLRFADSGPAGRRAVPGKEGENRAWMAGRIAVIQVIGAGIVEVDRLLHQAQAERSRIEIEVPARRACNGRNMMDAAEHAPLLFGVRRNSIRRLNSRDFWAAPRFCSSPRGRQPR